MQFVESLEPRSLFSAGQLDPSFGGDGIVDISLNAKAWAVASVEAAVDNAGRTIVAGFYRSRKLVTVTRLNDDGTVDASFGKNGIATLPQIGATEYSVLHVSVDHSGRPILLINNALTRLTTKGTFDKKFGTNGQLKVPLLRAASEVTVDARDNLLVVGTATGKSGDRGAIVRLGTKRGAVDASFGSSGAYKTPVPSEAGWPEGNARGLDLHVNDDGTIMGLSEIVYSDPANYITKRGISAFRLDARGTLDSTYGHYGSRELMGSSKEYTSSLYSFGTFTSDGTLYGQLVDHVFFDDQPDEYHYTLMKIDRNGRPQTPTTPAETPNAVFLGLQPDGKPLVRSAGQLYRLTTSLAFDATFSSIAVGDADVLSLDDDTLLLVQSTSTPSTVRVTAVQA